MLLDRIKADRLAAMKARDALGRDLLGTLLAAATKDDKAPGDARVARTVRAFVKALDETAGLVEARGGDASAQRAERAILEAYLPRALSEAELKASVAEVGGGVRERARWPEALGRVTAALKARHGDALDARAAGAAVKAALG
jgi:uncharacterized protein YqeY